MKRTPNLILVMTALATTPALAQTPPTGGGSAFGNLMESHHAAAAATSQPAATTVHASASNGIAPTVSPWLRLAILGREGLISRTQAHSDAIDRTGVGLYYGDHSSFADLSLSEKRAWIEQNKTQGTNPRMPSESSCIGWVLENVGAAYEAAGRGARWREIRARVIAKGAKGTDLALELQADGWQGVYWNPDTRKPSDGDAEHTFTAAQARKGRPYYKIRVDHLIVDYRPSSDSTTVQNNRGIESLAKVPFWFGLARGGRHTFVGHNDQLNEFHWTAAPDSKHAIDEKPFREFGWNSGIIMVPPGTWPAGN